MPHLDRFRNSDGKFVNFYKLLEIEQNATVSEVKKAYRSMAKKVHPDRVKENKLDAEEKFKLLNMANEVLQDNSLRQTYDRYYDTYIPRVHRWPTWFNQVGQKSKEETYRCYRDGEEDLGKHTEESSWTAGPIPDPFNTYGSRKWFERRPNNCFDTGTHPSYRPGSHPSYRSSHPSYRKFRSRGCRSGGSSRPNQKSYAESKYYEGKATKREAAPNRKPQPYSWSSRKKSAESRDSESSESESSKIEEVEEGSSSSEREIKLTRNINENKSNTEESETVSRESCSRLPKEGSRDSSEEKSNRAAATCSSKLTCQIANANSTRSVNSKDHRTSPAEALRPDVKNQMHSELEDCKASKKWKNPFAFSSLESSLPNESLKKSQKSDKSWFNPFDKEYANVSDTKEQLAAQKTHKSSTHYNPFDNPNPFALPNSFSRVMNPFVAEKRFPRVRKRYSARRSNVSRREGLPTSFLCSNSEPLDVDMSEPVAGIDRNLFNHL